MAVFRAKCLSFGVCVRDSFVLYCYWIIWIWYILHHTHRYVLMVGKSIINGGYDALLQLQGAPWQHIRLPLTPFFSSSLQEGQKRGIWRKSCSPAYHFVFFFSPIWLLAFSGRTTTVMCQNVHTALQWQWQAWRVNGDIWQRKTGRDSQKHEWQFKTCFRLLKWKMIRG